MLKLYAESLLCLFSGLQVYSKFNHAYEYDVTERKEEERRKCSGCPDELNEKRRRGKKISVTG